MVLERIQQMRCLGRYVDERANRMVYSRYEVPVSAVRSCFACFIINLVCTSAFFRGAVQTATQGMTLMYQWFGISWKCRRIREQSSPTRPFLESPERDTAKQGRQYLRCNAKSAIVVVGHAEKAGHSRAPRCSFAAMFARLGPTGHGAETRSSAGRSPVEKAGCGVPPVPTELQVAIYGSRCCSFSIR
jgi:hypothetical protein